MRHLIRNACVITVNADGDVFDPGFVLVEDARIAAIGPMSAVPVGPFDRETDARGAFLSPGLINLHQHVYMNLLKGLADGMRLEKWTAGFTTPSRAVMTWDDFDISFRLGALEMLRTGTTTFFNHGIARSVDSSEAHVAAIYREAGMRQILAVPYQIRTPAQADHPFGPAEADANLRAICAELNGDPDEMTRCAAVIECNAHHTRAGRSSDELVLAGYATASALDLRIASHMTAGTMSLTMGFTMYKRLTGRSDVEYLKRLGVLDHRWLLIHGIHFTDTDRALVAQAGASVVYTPTSESMRGGGIGPWVDMVRDGIVCALGSDGPAVDYSVDMVEQMKATCLFQSLRHRRPLALDCETALRMATIWGARAIGMDHAIGSLEVGKRADLVLFDRNRPGQILTDDPVAGFVMATNGSDARLVVVNGDIAYEDGRFAAGINAAEIAAEARRRAARINRDSGFAARAEPSWPQRRAKVVPEKWI